MPDTGLGTSTIQGMVKGKGGNGWREHAGWAHMDGVGGEEWTRKMKDCKWHVRSKLEQSCIFCFVF